MIDKFGNDVVILFQESAIEQLGSSPPLGSEPVYCGFLTCTMFLVDCIKCLVWSEHHSIQIYLITFFEIIKFCMLLQQEINVPGLSNSC